MPDSQNSRRLFHAAALALLTSVPALLHPYGLAAATVEEAIARGDRAWADRSDGHQGARARPEPVEQAISAYTAALEEDPTRLEARWKLLRALYFKGEFVLDDKEDRLALFARGREIADAGRRQIEQHYDLAQDSLEMKPREVAEAIGSDETAAKIYFWSSTHWGLWGRYRGKFAAAREGVASKIRKFAEIVILLDEEVENAGGHRVLGRLNAEAPKIPLVTGWIDRDLAISELRRARELAPTDLLTQVFLAEALLDYRPENREEALALLDAVVASEPDPRWLVEEIKAIDDAKALLARFDD